MPAPQQPGKFSKRKTVCAPELNDKSIRTKVTYSESATDLLGLEQADYLISKLYPAEKKHGRKIPPKEKPVAALNVESVEKTGAGSYRFGVTICSSRGENLNTVSFFLRVKTHAPHQRFEETLDYDGIPSIDLQKDFKRAALLLGEDAYNRIKSLPVASLTDATLPKPPLE